MTRYIVVQMLLGSFAVAVSPWWLLAALAHTSFGVWVVSSTKTPAMLPAEVLARVRAAKRRAMNDIITNGLLAALGGASLAQVVLMGAGK